MSVKTCTSANQQALSKLSVLRFPPKAWKHSNLFGITDDTNQQADVQSMHTQLDALGKELKALDAMEVGHLLTSCH